MMLMSKDMDLGIQRLRDPKWIKLRQLQNGFTILFFPTRHQWTRIWKRFKIVIACSAASWLRHCCQTLLVWKIGFRSYIASVATLTLSSSFFFSLTLTHTNYIDNEYSLNLSLLLFTYLSLKNLSKYIPFISLSLSHTHTRAYSSR